MTQGNRVKEIRKSLQLTMEQFGQKIGVTKSTISNIENGNRNATEHMLKSICREFNVNEDWLRYESGDMFNEPEDEIADIVSNIIENPESQLYQTILQIVRTYAELSPESQKIVDAYVKKLGENLRKQD